MNTGIRCWRLYLLLSLALVLMSASVEDHALLARSDPATNASLQSAPSEIRLWFTEPDYSSFNLLDSDSNPVKTPHSQASDDGWLQELRDLKRFECT